MSAHDRKRIYWTNVHKVALPKNTGTVLRDVLEPAENSLYLKQQVANRYCPTLNYRLDSKKSCVIGKLSKYQGDRVFDIRAKGSSLSACGGNNAGGSCNIIHDPVTGKLRKLSVVECARLQGVPDHYADSVRAPAQYKMLGNGWTVDVIAHIFRHLPRKYRKGRI